MQRKRLSLVVAAMSLAVASAAWALTIVGSDNFDDGVRNKTLWQVVPYNTGKLTEMGGKLRYSTTSTNHASARWAWKQPYVLIDHDILESTFTLRMPFTKLFGNKQARMGVGFRDAYTPNRYVGFSMSASVSNRAFIVDTSNGSLFTAIPAGNLKEPVTIMLRIRYNNQYKRVSFAWKDPTNTTWKAVYPTGVDLNALWGAASQRTLQPYVYGVSFYAQVSNAWYHIDNFRVVNKIPE